MSSHLTFERNGSHLRILESPLRNSTGYVLAFGTVFFAAMFIWGLSVIGKEPELTAIYCFCFAAFGIFVAYHVAVLLFRYREYSFDANELTVKTRCLGFRWTRIIDRSHIWGLAEGFSIDKTGTKTFESKLCFDKTFLSIPCCSEDEQQMFSALVNAYLAETAGERLRCPHCYRGVWFNPQEFEHRCITCKSPLSEPEARSEGEKDFDETFNDGNLIRPLYSRIGFERSGTSLRLHFTAWHVRNTGHYIDLAAALIANIAVVLLAAGIFYMCFAANRWSFTVMVFLITTIGLLSAVLDSFFAEHFLELTPESLHYKKRGCLRRQTLNWNLQADGQLLTTFSDIPLLKNKYCLELSQSGSRKKIVLPCSGMEERRWLQEMINNR